METEAHPRCGPPVENILCCSSPVAARSFPSHKSHRSPFERKVSRHCSGCPACSFRPSPPLDVASCDPQRESGSSRRLDRRASRRDESQCVLPIDRSFALRRAVIEDPARHRAIREAEMLLERSRREWKVWPVAASGCCENYLARRPPRPRKMRTRVRAFCLRVREACPRVSSLF